MKYGFRMTGLTKHAKMLIQIVTIKKQTGSMLKLLLMISLEAKRDGGTIIRPQAIK
jgi:hypothetical protein